MAHRQLGGAGMAGRFRSFMSQIRAVFMSTRGSWDLGSVMVGITVAAALLTAAGIGVVAVISAAQDRNAISHLEEVRDAQRAALSADRGYLSFDRLVERGFLRHENSAQIGLGYPSTGSRQTNELGST